MSIENSQSATCILDRIKAAYALKSDADLARLFQKDPSTVSTWRRRDTLDYTLIFSKCQDLNANYVLFGDLPLYRPAAGMELTAGQGHSMRPLLERIRALAVCPDTKMALLKACLEILEEREGHIPE